MQNVMSVIVSFFEQKNQKIINLNFKLTSKGQVEYFTGEIHPGIGNKEESEALEKTYRKNVSSTDYRYLNTELSVTGTKFSITKN